MAYAPNGLMSKETFLSLCRVNKLLQKSTCTSVMAGAVFDRALRPLPRDPDASPRTAETLGFNQFRNLVVPEFAKLKKVEEGALIDRLSRCEFPSSVTLAGSQLSRSQKEPAEAPADIGAVAAGEQSDQPPPAADPPPAQSEPAHPKLHLNVSAEFVSAFTQLQSISRRKMAKRKMEQMKEVSAAQNRTVGFISTDFTIYAAVQCR